LTIRRWFYLFCSTLGWGMLSGFITGIILISTNNEFVLWEESNPGFNAVNIINILLAGATFSVLSQMGFFSYLIVRYIAIGLFKNKSTWELIQSVLVIVAVVELTFLRYINFAAPGETWLNFLLLPVVLLLIALGVSYWKVKLTKPSSFIPTLLFMYVVTILEAIPALRLNSPPSYFFMLTPLIVCNAWQILQLHRLIRTR
jgi:KinB signaling pathway activation protein